MHNPISETEHVAHALGDFVANSKCSDLPASVLHEGKRSILNMIGSALGAAHHPDFERFIKLLAPVRGPAQATIFGRHERFDILNAAFLNAISANLLDFDDTHLATVIHPSAPVAPPLLALAQERGLSGADLLHAFVLGAEIECRLGNAVSPTHYARGWHITATCGVFGAAAACAKLLRLDAAKTGHALGIAAAQSGSITENLAPGAKNIGVGNAARGGLFSALAAEAGVDAAERAIEGRQGWAQATGDPLKTDVLFADLGKRWEIAKNTYKPYPCGIVLHAVIDACLDLRRRYALTADDIASGHGDRTSAPAHACGPAGKQCARRKNQHSSQCRGGVPVRCSGSARILRERSVQPGDRCVARARPGACRSGSCGRSGTRGGTHHGRQGIGHRGAPCPRQPRAAHDGWRD